MSIHNAFAYPIVKKRPRVLVFCIIATTLLVLSNGIGNADEPAKGARPPGFELERFEILESAGEGDVRIVNKQEAKKSYQKILERYQADISRRQRRVVLMKQSIFQDISNRYPTVQDYVCFFAEDRAKRIIHFSRQPGAISRDRIDFERVGEKEGEGTPLHDEKSRFLGGLNHNYGWAFLVGGDGRAIFVDQPNLLISERSLASLFGFIPPEYLPFLSAGGIIARRARLSRSIELLEKMPDEVIEYKDGRRWFTWINGRLHRSIEFTGDPLLPTRLEVYFVAKPILDPSKPRLKYVSTRTLTQWDRSTDHPRVSRVDMDYHSAGAIVRKGNNIRSSFEFEEMDPHTEGYEVFFDQQSFGLLTPPVEMDAFVGPGKKVAK